MNTNAINEMALRARSSVTNLNQGITNLDKALSTKPSIAKAKSSKSRSSSTKKTTTSSKSSKPSSNDSSKIASLAQKVKNLTSSSSSILDKFKGQIPAEDYTRLQLQQALEQRSQMISLVTNLMQTMHEMAMNVIRNFRVS